MLNRSSITVLSIVVGTLLTAWAATAPSASAYSPLRG